MRPALRPNALRDLDFIKVGRRRLITRQSLERFLNIAASDHYRLHKP